MCCVQTICSYTRARVEAVQVRPGRLVRGLPPALLVDCVNGQTVRLVQFEGVLVVGRFKVLNSDCVTNKGCSQ